MMDIQKVKLHMADLLTEPNDPKHKIVRTICCTNAYNAGNDCYELGTKEDQRLNLEKWIAERGNHQHNTLLQLDSWEFC